MISAKTKPSPSRTYVIMLDCNDFTGFRFKKFHLPETNCRTGETIENTCEMANWYFYNYLDGFSCGYDAFPYEDYLNIVEI